MARIPTTRKKRPATADGPDRNQEQEALAPLNFKLAREFRREFRTFASPHEMKMSRCCKRASISLKNTVTARSEAHGRDD